MGAARVEERGSSDGGGFSGSTHRVELECLLLQVDECLGLVLVVRQLHDQQRWNAPARMNGGDSDSGDK